MICLKLTSMFGGLGPANQFLTRQLKLKVRHHKLFTSSRFRFRSFYLFQRSLTDSVSVLPSFRPRILQVFVIFIFPLLISSFSPIFGSRLFPASDSVIFPVSGPALYHTFSTVSVFSQPPVLSIFQSPVIHFRDFRSIHLPNWFPSGFFLSFPQNAVIIICIVRTSLNSLCPIKTWT